MVKYYTQCASHGGLIVSEATPVSIRGNGYAGAPGIYDLRPNGEAPVAPSAVAAEGYAYTKHGEAAFSMPRPSTAATRAATRTTGRRGDVGGLTGRSS
jgi:N-ethylmaleimide reductase